MKKHFTKVSNEEDTKMVALEKTLDVYFKSLKDNGITYISERIRNGYIGDRVYTGSGEEFMQITRGKPIGTFVAYVKDEKIVFGASMMHHDERKDDPKYGLYLALSSAMSDKPSFSLPEKYAQQFEHFQDRARRYFEPKLFSYSKGSKSITPDGFYQTRLIQQFVNVLNKTTKESLSADIKKLNEDVEAYILHK